MAPMDTPRIAHLPELPVDQFRCLNNVVVVVGVIFLAVVFYILARTLSLSSKIPKSRETTALEQVNQHHIEEKMDFDVLDSPLSTHSPFINSGTLAAEADEKLTARRQQEEQQHCQQVSSPELLPVYEHDYDVPTAAPQHQNGFLSASTIVRDETEIFADPTTPFGFWRRRTLEFEVPASDEQQQ